MADIELVIKIDEEDLERIKVRINKSSSDFIILNGKPLPKGHGRLIDADKLNTRERGNNSQRTMWWNIDQIVRNAPTIIEADKEEKQDEVT